MKMPESFSNDPEKGQEVHTALEGRHVYWPALYIGPLTKFYFLDHPKIMHC